MEKSYGLAIRDEGLIKQNRVSVAVEIANAEGVETFPPFLALRANPEWFN